MKINDTTKSVSQTKVNKPTAPAKKAGSPSKAGRGRGGEDEKVDLGPLSTQLAALAARLEEIEVVDRARVERIRKEISEGRFTVDADAIADRLVSAAREMVLKRKGGR